MKTAIEKIKAEQATIKKIDLSEQYSLSEIPEIIKNCHQLERLDVSFTGISIIPDFIFQLPKLKEFKYLCCNKLQKQPKSFSAQQPLEKLAIYVGQGQSISDEITSLKNLKSLTISGKLKEIPKSIFNIANIEELELFDTKVSVIAPEIRNLTKLKKLSFLQALFLSSEKPASLRLSEVFHNLSECNSLKELRLDSNGIKEIPTNIELLTQLQVFSAKDNFLTSYPDSLYNLPNLKELDLSINQIQEISKGISKLTQLKILKFNSNWKNNLVTKNLFDEISGLVNLETLELWSCQSIKEIPETISNLKKLKKLDLDNNLLQTLPKSMRSMHQLKTLRVTTNQISSAEIAELEKHLPNTKIIA